MKPSKFVDERNSSYNKVFSFFKENAFFCVILRIYLKNFSMQYQCWNQLNVLISIKVSL